MLFRSSAGIYRDGETEAVVGIDTLTSEIARRFGAFKMGESGGIMFADEYGRPVLPLISKDLPILGYRFQKPKTENQFQAMPKFSSRAFSISDRTQDYVGEDGETYITLARSLKIKDHLWYVVFYQKKIRSLCRSLRSVVCAIELGFCCVLVGLVDDLPDRPIRYSSREKRFRGITPVTRCCSSSDQSKVSVLVDDEPRNSYSAQCDAGICRVVA